MSNQTHLRTVGDRIEALIQDLGSHSDPGIREKSEELVRLLMEFYGAGLARMMEAVGETNGAAAGLCEHFAEDPLIASLLALHGLHPLTCETRIQRALDRVRPALGTHGGDVTLLSVRDGVVRVRLEGSCHGCPSSTITMQMTIQCAIEEAAPEVIRIDVEGLEADSTLHVKTRYQTCPNVERVA